MFCSDRPYPEMNVEKMHDEWLIDLWNSTIEKKDIVYMVGDFAFGNKIMVTKLLGKLRGQKHLILGNHDASSSKLSNYFESMTQIKDLGFKASVYPFLKKNFLCLRKIKINLKNCCFFTKHILFVLWIVSFAKKHGNFKIIFTALQSASLFL